jgi:hypothetical protein
MIHKSKFKKDHEKIRKWAKAHKEEIYAKYGKQCQKCGEHNISKLTFHHKQYIIGLEYIEVLCNKCHREFHDLELRKKMLIFILHDFKSNNVSNDTTVGQYKKELWERINKIPIEIASGLGFQGLDFNFDDILKSFCFNENGTNINKV